MITSLVIDGHKKGLNIMLGTHFHSLGAKCSQETNGNNIPRKCRISKHDKGTVSTWQVSRKELTPRTFRFRHFPFVCLLIKLKLIYTSIQKPIV